MGVSVGFWDERWVWAGRALLGGCGSSVGMLWCAGAKHVGYSRCVMRWRRAAVGGCGNGDRCGRCGLAMCTAVSGWFGGPAAGWSTGGRQGLQKDGHGEVFT